MFVRLMVQQHNMYVDVFNDLKVDYYYNTQQNGQSQVMENERKIKKLHFMIFMCVILRFCKDESYYFKGYVWFQGNIKKKNVKDK